MFDDRLVIKLAVSAASLNLQGALAVPAVRKPSHRAWAPLQIQGGCASSRLDHGCKIPSREAALAADWITTAPKLTKNQHVFKIERIMI